MAAGTSTTDVQARQIYARFLGGDEDAFVELVEAYKDGLIGFLEKLVGDVEVAQDLAIDAFVVVMTPHKPYLGKAAFQTWLYAIGKKLAFKYLRKHARQAYYSLEDFADETGVSSPEDAMLDDADKAQVQTAIRGLPADYRCALYLLFFENMSYADVGVVMRKTDGQVRGLVYRAKQVLKATLESEGFSLA